MRLNINNERVERLAKQRATETGQSITPRHAETRPELDELGIEIVGIDVKQTQLGRELHQRFGTGSHPAKLNLGDCFAHALSKARSEPPPFKGDDFRQTDVEAAI